jgi:hypothetical protein
MTWQERALDNLARARREHDGLAWRNTQVVAWDTNGMPAQVTVEVESTSIADLWYTVRYHVQMDNAQCLCTAGGYHQACAHSGLAIEQGRKVVAQYTRQARAAARREARLAYRDEMTAQVF